MFSKVNRYFKNTRRNQIYVSRLLNKRVENVLDDLVKQLQINSKEHRLTDYQVRSLKNLVTSGMAEYNIIDDSVNISNVKLNLSQNYHNPLYHSIYNHVSGNPIFGFASLLPLLLSDKNLKDQQFTKTLLKRINDLWSSEDARRPLIESLANGCQWLNHDDNRDYSFEEFEKIFDSCKSSRNFNETLGIIKSSFDVKSHPYFTWLISEESSKNQFALSQQAFFYAVSGWAQVISAVVSKVEEPTNREVILQNLLDEFGGGDKSESHPETFRAFLRALSLEKETPECPVHISAFLNSILGLCYRSPHEATAAVGIIEYLYVDISSILAYQINHKKWVLPGSQKHYAVHEELDVTHSEDLLRIPKNLLESNHKSKEVEDGTLKALYLGAYYFWVLYKDMLKVAKNNCIN
eukprot:TRINITY_DN5803_c0_g1_i1.p1 TRINITY_DN5803_c0_g1~~TRINITY_DN5803_c0_g1_i1.p1  ORF type:complete len:407 (-),score=27.45 TRINITY_DN5803_c0_g1_i1:14-1234(-)